MIKLLLFAAIGCLCVLGPQPASAGDGEITGQLEPTLVTNNEDLDKVVLRGVQRSQLKGTIDLPDGAHLAATRLTDPRTQKASIMILLVEDLGMDPIVFVDINGDDQLATTERFTLKPEEEDNPYLWETTVGLVATDGPFRSIPIYIEYFKSIKIDKMGPNDRLIRQSTTVMARAKVAIGGKDVIFQYSYDPDSKRIDPLNGWLGVDTDGDGKVEIDSLSPESTEAKDETVVFRAGDVFVSTKKVDVGKNQVTIRQHQAKEYKRAELWTGKEFPDFAFTDFNGKKHGIKDYRGKYVLLDVWGFWCPACRDELPYLREANRRFTGRGLILIGLDTDENYTVDSMRDGLKKVGMDWTQGQFESVVGFLGDRLRLHSFPSTFLISPEGKIISMNRTSKNEKSLRGADLLETLDDVLPPL